MNTKKNIKIIGIIIIFAFILFGQYSNVLATNPPSASDIVSGADDFVETGEGASKPFSDDVSEILSDTIYNILFVIGVIITVIIGAVLGIKFMTGSIEEKSKVKESLVPFFAGCAVIYGAFGIWKLAIIVLRGLA